MPTFLTALKRLSLVLIVFPFFGCFKSKSQVQDPTTAPGSLYDFSMPDIKGNPVSLADYKGKVVVVVNVASKCGLTPQYEGLEAFYKKYQEKGVVVLGFPANNFMGQEPGSADEIQSFCKVNYGVTFPLFTKISVKGSDKAPLYGYLTKATGEEVSWNFQKFIVNREGKVVKSISPRTHIDDPEVIKLIEGLL